MSPIARVFIVINLILAVAFVAFSGNLLHHGESYMKKYDEEVQAHKNTKDKLNAQISKLQADLSAKNQDYLVANGKANNLETKNKALEREIRDLKANVEENTNSLRKVSASLDNFNTSLDNARAEIKGLRDKEAGAVKAKDDAEQARLALEEKALGLENDIEKLNKKIGDYKVEIVQLTDKTDHYQTLLSIARDRGFSVDMATPAISAKVLKVDTSLKTVLLSVGSDDKVKKGFTFYIYKNKEFKGSVVVVNITPKNCYARMEVGFPGRTISVNDDAKTHL